MSSAASFLITLVDAAGRSLLLAGAVACGLWALRARNVVAQKAAWILVLAGSLAMPLVASWAAHFSWLPDKDTFLLTGRMWTSQTVRHDAPPVAMSASMIVNRESDRETQAQTPAHAMAPAEANAASHFPAPSIAHFSEEPAAAATPEAPAPLFRRVRAAVGWLSPARDLLLLYGAVTGIFLLRLCFGAWAAARLWSRAEPVRLDRCLVQDGIKVRSSGAIASPVTVAGGIVLPADYAGWDREKLGIVLAHEGSHVRQRDFGLQLAASVYIALFWFSPLGWWVKRKLSDLSETISDGAAVRQAASHASYAQVLLEFAALPRPIPIGVAMAHRGHLRSRIEHLLNESRFRQAFSGGRARLAAAVLLVPAALFVSTAMVRVHAAGQQAPPPATAPEPAQAPQTPAAPQATPNRPPAAVTAPSEPSTPQAPPDDQGAAVLAAPEAPGNPSWAVPTAPAPGELYSNVFPNPKILAGNARAMVLLKEQMARNMALEKPYYFPNGFWNDGNSYAYVTGTGKQGIHYSGNWFDGSRDEIDKARKVAHGDFLWFERDGKSYVIDDPAVLAEIKPMQDRMDALGEQQAALGKQQEELGKQQEALSKQMDEVKVPTPDMNKELAKLQAVQAKLAAIQGKDTSQEQLAEIQNELAEIQGRIGGIQGEMGGRMGDLGGKMGALGGQQGKLGAEQGRLGAQQGRLAREMDGKVLTIIDESVKNGKARPVQ